MVWVALATVESSSCDPGSMHGGGGLVGERREGGGTQQLYCDPGILESS